MTKKHYGGDEQKPQKAEVSPSDKDREKPRSTFEVLTGTLGLAGLVIGIASVSRLYAILFATLVAVVLVNPWAYRWIGRLLALHVVWRCVVLTVVVIVGGRVAYNFLDRVARERAVPKAGLILQVKPIGFNGPATTASLDLQFINLGPEIAYDATYLVGVERYEIKDDSSAAAGTLLHDVSNALANKAAQNALTDEIQLRRYQWDKEDIFPNDPRSSTYPSTYRAAPMPSFGWGYVIVGITSWTDTGGSFEARRCLIIERGESYQCNVQHSIKVLRGAGS
ncbi:MAG: hypothetical protein ABIQ86_12930 [Steroidobacteraceae bacterium]